MPGFSLFLDISLLVDRVLHKEEWVAKLLDTHLSIQVHKRVKFTRRDNSPLALKVLKNKILQAHFEPFIHNSYEKKKQKKNSNLYSRFFEI